MSNKIEQDLKELQSKNQKVVEGSIKINTQIETAQINYKKTQEISLAKFQTANIEELEAILAKWRAENQKRYDLAVEQTTKLANNYNETVRLIKEIQEGQQ